MGTSFGVVGAGGGVVTAGDVFGAPMTSEQGMMGGIMASSLCGSNFHPPEQQFPRGESPCTLSMLDDKHVNDNNNAADNDASGYMDHDVNVVSDTNMSMTGDATAASDNNTSGTTPLSSNNSNLSSLWQKVHHENGPTGGMAGQDMIP